MEGIPNTVQIIHVSAHSATGERLNVDFIGHVSGGQVQTMIMVYYKLLISKPGHCHQLKHLSPVCVLLLPHLLFLQIKTAKAIT